MAFGAVNPLSARPPTPTPMGAGGTPLQSWRPNPNAIVGAGSYGPGNPGSTNRSAVAGAKLFKDTLGLPSFTDLIDRFGGGGTKEFGNAGIAGEGAAFAKDELGGWKKNLGQGRAELMKLRRGIADPTSSEGFKSVMRLNSERLGAATEDERQAQAEAASRRGYVGGYNPAKTEQNRLEAIAMAGGEARDAERKALQTQYGLEGDLYGKDVQGYGNAMGAYTDLARTAAELPTKWLDAYSNLLGGAGNFGDIFRTSSGNVQFDVGNQRSDAARVRQDRIDFANRARAAGASGQY